MRTKHIVLIILALLAIYTIAGINSIPRLDEAVKASWSQVENQYQRRADLVPNLVKTVKGYAAHEKNTISEVTQARTDATRINISTEDLNDPAALKRFEEAQSRLGSALSRLIAVSESYPDLKASQNFLALQSQLEGTENRISVARRDYIESVQRYNTAIRTFPGMLWAKLYSAEPKAVFTATIENADKAPEVEF